VFQFIPNDCWKDHSVKQRWKNVDMPDEDQIIDRASVGDYQLHLSESQTLEVLYIAPHFLNGDIGPHPMGLQKVVEFVTRLKAQ
jgi:hypothetical protein